MKIELEKKITLKNRLINSISLLEGSIYYTSALGNCVYKYDMSSEKESMIIDGGCGYGKYKFREPVHAFVYKELNNVNIIVSDWHNHRVIKYQNGEYLTELGFFSPTKSLLKNILKFIKGLSISGQYYESHFRGEDIRHSVETDFFPNFFYMISSSCRLFSKRLFSFNKPNGTCFYKGGLLLTQKNNNCLTHTDLNLNPIRNYVIPESGRLGNINSLNGQTLFCVESIGKVFNIDGSGNISAVNLRKIDIEFKPFSARYISDDIIAVISMSYLHIFDILDGREVIRKKIDGELHGLEADSDYIYVSDRLHSKVYKMRLSYD